jgi:hypothetical protein
MDAGRRAPRAAVGKSPRFLGLLSSSRSRNYRLGGNAITPLTILTILTILRIARAAPFDDRAKSANSILKLVC